MELTDGVIVLRRLSDGDVARIVEGCSDSLTSRFVPALPVPYREEDARAYLRHAEDAWAVGDRLPLAIADASTDLLLGAIELRRGEIGSVGYWVHPSARGRGIAGRALRLLSRWALTAGGVERLELTTDPDNTASQRVATGAGFVREGVLRSHMRHREGRRDSVLFSLLPGDL